MSVVDESEIEIPPCILPLYLDETRWKKSPPDDILYTIQDKDELKPVNKEWEEYFKWLGMIGFTVNAINDLRSKKPWSRPISGRLCFFLHFLRLGFPLEEIKPGRFNTRTNWKGQNRKAWRKAACVIVPMIDNSIDWWCTTKQYNSISNYPTHKICHILQTSEIGVDEIEERKEIVGKIFFTHENNFRFVFFTKKKAMELVEINRKKIDFLEKPKDSNWLKNWRVQKKQLDRMKELLVEVQAMVEKQEPFNINMAMGLQNKTVELTQYQTACFGQFDALQLEEERRIQEELIRKEQLKREEMERELERERERELEEQRERERQEMIANQTDENNSDDRNIIIEGDGTQETQIIIVESNDKPETPNGDESNDSNNKVIVDNQPESPISSSPDLSADNISDQNNNIETNQPSEETRDIPSDQQNSNDPPPQDTPLDSDALSKYTKERQQIIKLLANPPPLGTEVLFEVYSGMERFIIERLVSIAKHLELSDEMTADLLHANQTISESTEHKMKRISLPPRRRRENSADKNIQESLYASGLLS